MLLNASLDTSFWNIASQIGVASYLFGFFRVHYCQAVRDEIIATDPSETSLVFPQAMLFTIFDDDGRFFRSEPEQPSSRFGIGEAHALTIAKENNWVLLINDRRPLDFAISLGIRTVCVPDFCVFLYSQGKITENAARGYLERIKPTTSPKLIEAAIGLLDTLSL